MANLSTTYSGAAAGPFTKIGTGMLTLGHRGVGTVWRFRYRRRERRDLATQLCELAHRRSDADDYRNLYGRALYLLGNASGASSQTIRGITVASGDGQIAVNVNGGSGTTLNLGRDPTATAVGGGLNFNAMPGAVAIATTSSALVDGSYGGRLTYTDSTGNTDFIAAVTSVGSTSTLGRYTGYNAFTGTTSLARRTMLSWATVPLASRKPRIS